MDLYTLISDLKISNQKRYNFKINELCIHFFSNNPTDYTYLHNFLCCGSSENNQLPNYVVYLDDLNEPIKQYLLHCVKFEKDKKIINHITDFHFCHNYETNKSCIEVYYGEKQDYFIVRQKNYFYILCSKECSKRTSLALYVIRELIYREYENNDAICLHAASCKVYNRGIALVGKPGSGKTGLLMALLEDKCADFISNDRVLVTLNMNLLSIPMPIRISIDSIVSSEILYQYVIDNERLLCRKQNFDVNKMKLVKTKCCREKLEVSPLELSKCFSVNCLDNSNLDVIIVPAFSCQFKEGIEIEKINPEEIENILLQNCYTPKDPLWPEPWFGRKNIVDDWVVQRIKRIVNTIPAYKVKFGIDVHRSLKKIDGV